MSIFTAVVLSLLLDDTLLDPWRDQERGDSHTEPRKIERDVLLVRRGLGVCDIIAGGDIDGSGNMIAKSTMLVESKDEECLIPLRRGAESFVDFLDEKLSLGDGRGWMERVVRAALWIDVCKLRERSSAGVAVELCQWLDVRCRLPGRGCPFVEQGIRGEAGSVRVIDPGYGLLRELLEDGALGQASDIERIVIAAVTVGGP